MDSSLSGVDPFMGPWRQRNRLERCCKGLDEKSNEQAVAEAAQETVGSRPCWSSGHRTWNAGVEASTVGRFQVDAGF